MECSHKLCDIPPFVCRGMTNNLCQHQGMRTDELRVNYIGAVKRQYSLINFAATSQTVKMTATVWLTEMSLCLSLVST